MSPETTKSSDRTPSGFDPGLQCLALVFAWTLIIRYLLPIASHAHNRMWIMLAMTTDFIVLLLIFLFSMIIWLRRDDAAIRPPRKWMLLLALLWVSAQIVVWLGIMFRHDAVADKQEPPPPIKTHSQTFLKNSDEKGGIVLEMDGVLILLPQGWEALKQPKNLFVQQRARNRVNGMAVSAGAVQMDFPLEQYVALGVAGAELSPEQQFEKISTLTGIPTAEIEKAMASTVGRTMLKKIQEPYRSLQFEILAVKSITISGERAFDIHSKITQKSGQVIYSRQFTLNGTSSNVIVNVTFAGGSEDFFEDDSLQAAIKK